MLFRSIEEGETKFGVSLTDAEKEKIIGVMDKINKLGLDPETLLNQAKDLYAKYGNDLLENPERAIGEIIKNTVSNFFEKIGSGIKSFFSNLFR